MRITHALVQVTLALMATPDGQHWGYDLHKRSGVRSGVLYPMLTRMLDAGWLTAGWGEGHPPRRYYTLTSGGRAALGGIIETARQDRRFTGLFQPSTGAGLGTNQCAPNKSGPVSQASRDTGPCDVLARATAVSLAHADRGPPRGPVP